VLGRMIEEVALVGNRTIVGVGDQPVSRWQAARKTVP
jgi:hypothetical protein